MCNQSGIDFVRATVQEVDVLGKRVLEVGALDVNGSVRPTILELAPGHYWGVDLEDGPGVDERCDAEDLVNRFGTNSFDVVVATELIEHVKEWRAVISNLKRVLAPNGLLIVTTRSLGYPYHGAPDDFWRYEASDMREIFSDLSIEALAPDPLAPGVFVGARKPAVFSEQNLRGLALHSMVANRRVRTLSAVDLARFRMKRIRLRPIAQRSLRLARSVTPPPLRRWARRRWSSIRSAR